MRIISVNMMTRIIGTLFPKEYQFLCTVKLGLFQKYYLFETLQFQWVTIMPKTALKLYTIQLIPCL